jgi:hypothetical protein
MTPAHAKRGRQLPNRELEQSAYRRSELSSNSLIVFS